MQTPRPLDDQPWLLGTRGSPLALAQAQAVQAALAAHGQKARSQVFSTRGDRRLDVPLYELGDKGLFTQELEQALGDGSIAAAVHSAKDMSALDDPALPLVAALPRASRHDVLLSVAAGVSGPGLAGLPNGAKVGTSSLRRAAQIQGVRPDLRIEPVRGNVQTRLAALRDGRVAALILAAAGLERLDQGQSSHEQNDLTAGLHQANLLEQEGFLPAPAQGIIAVQTGKAMAGHRHFAGINDQAAWLDLLVERALVRGLGAHCRLPVACLVQQIEGETPRLEIELNAWCHGALFEASSVLLPKDGAAGLATLALEAEGIGAEMRARLPQAFFSQ